MRISMVRGDIKWIRFLINTPNGIPTDIDFTNVYFTVKKLTSDRDPIFQKSLKREEIYKLNLGDYELKIDAADTCRMAVGNYKFDIQVSYKNLLKESFVGDFELREEVTYYINEDEEEEAEEDEFPVPHVPTPTADILVIPDYHVLKLETPISVSVMNNYENLRKKPVINGVELVGELTLEDLGITPELIHQLLEEYEQQEHEEP